MKCPRHACRAPMELIDHGVYRCSVESCGATVILSESATVRGLSEDDRRAPVRPVSPPLPEPPAVAVWTYPPTRVFEPKVCANCLLNFTPNSSTAEWCALCAPVKRRQKKEQELERRRKLRATQEYEPAPNMLPIWHPRYQVWLANVRAGQERARVEKAS